jgi:SAM-dependent methyltransferase
MKEAEAFWDDRYQNNATGWDIGKISPPLEVYFNQLTNKKLSILIPGCGNAYEAEYLVKNGFTNVTLIDISETLCNKLKEKFAGIAINILHGDYFEHQGKYDLIIEQTFFCAINPSLRKDYVTKTHSLLNEYGKLVGLLFNRTFEGGPPFGGSKEEYTQLFKPNFYFKHLDACYNSINQRQGTELFVNFLKK